MDADLLIPGSGQPIADGTVVLEGSTIAYAGPQSGAPPSEQLVHVPAVMPGLWDCHGHYTGMVDPDLEKDVTVHAATKAARTTADLAATLDAGVTSVRGNILSTTGGHVDVHALPLAWLMAPHSSPMGVLCDGVPECLKAVRTQLRKGADVIKLWPSGGVMSEIDHPVHQQFSDEELRAIVEEAARAERAVAAHCHGRPGILAAVRAGVTTIEAIEAATANGPLTLGLRAPKSGLLKTDYDADVIAFDADPLVDNSVWGDPSRVTHVWKAGELVKG